MKKLILTTGILLSTSLWADDEAVCDTTVYEDNPRSYTQVAQLIKRLNCNEGDILNVIGGRNFVQIDEQMVIALHCDLNQTVHRTNMGFICVLTNVEGRPIRKIPRFQYD